MHLPDEEEAGGYGVVAHGTPWKVPCVLPRTFPATGTRGNHPCSGTGADERPQDEQNTVEVAHDPEEADAVVQGSYADISQWQYDIEAECGNVDIDYRFQAATVTNLDTGEELRYSMREDDSGEVSVSCDD